jgi:hypothetical protein
MKKFFLERLLPISLLLQINKKPRVYKKGQNNMFIRATTIEEVSERAENISLEKNIILCTPSHLSIFKQNRDGTISLNLDRDENLSATKVTRDGTVAILDYIPKIKMSIPQGIKLNIDSPSFQFCFFDKIYPSCEMYYQGVITEDPQARRTPDELPPYISLADFKITFHIDLTRLRQSRGSFVLKKGQSVANLYFVELPHFRDNGEVLEKIIYFRNTEIYDTFLNVF